MNRHILLHAVFTALSMAAVATPAAAAVLASAPARPPQLVDDATLAQVSGKYLNQQMLIGLRIDLVSTLSAPHGSSSASGTLLMQPDGRGGMTLRVDSRSSAQAGSAPLPADNSTLAQGGNTLQVNGIAQVAQLAGDDNRMLNLTQISFGALDTTGDFNGRTESASTDGAMMAQIRFDDGAQLRLSAPGSQLQQRIGLDGTALMQSGQIAGNHVSASNQLTLQLMTRDMSVMQHHRLGIQQALSSLAPMGR